MERVDTKQTIETPEGVEFDVYPSGPVLRVLAASIDLMIRVGVYLVIAPVLACLGGVGIGLFFVILFLSEWGYPIYFEMFHDGMTPGKRIFGIQVLSADGTPVTWRGSILRNLMRVADFLPVVYAGGIGTMLVTARFQRLGDLAGDTMVCYTRTSRAPSAGELPAADPVTLSRRLTPDEQQAIVEFAERSQQWSSERCRELAGILAPLTGCDDDREGVEYLRGAARAILEWS